MIPSRRRQKGLPQTEPRREAVAETTCRLSNKATPHAIAERTTSPTKEEANTVLTRQVAFSYRNRPLIPVGHAEPGQIGQKERRIYVATGKETLGCRPSP